MREMVVGDIVKIYEGDMIKEEIRIIEQSDMFISKEVINGEEIKVEKYEKIGEI